MSCITLVAITSIQDFVFRSNRLKENAGASFLAEEALEKLAAIPCQKRIYAAAGGAALVFVDETAARAAIRQWSKKLFDDAPGLRVVVAHQEIREGKTREAFRAAQKKLAQAEEQVPAGWPLGALPVVRACQSTGLAANERDDQDQSWLSAEAIAKRKAGDLQRKQLKEDFSDILGNLQFPNELSDLGTEEGASQIAVVHADGNGIGQEFIRLTREGSDADFFDRYKDLSSMVSDVARGALRATIQELVERWDRTGSLPIRPIVHAGDDLTFVCKGKYGLALAASYLRNFQAQAKAKGKTWTARAGVVIMREKFPFARGYRLADDLAREAKNARKEADDKENSWLDFQVVLEGSAGNLNTMRDQQYARVKLMRPYHIGGPSDSRDWQRFEWLWRRFTSPDWPRNRAKRLLEAMARGEHARNALLVGFKAAGVKEPRESAAAFIERQEYWDPLEMLDFHVDWEEEKRKKEEKLYAAAQN